MQQSTMNLFFFSWTQAPCFASESDFLVSAQLRPCRKVVPLRFKEEAGQTSGSLSVPSHGSTLEIIFYGAIPLSRGWMCRSASRSGDSGWA